MLTRQQLYELDWEGPEVIVRLIEQFYEPIAAAESPEVRALRLSVDPQLQVLKKLQSRPQRLDARLAHQECLNYELKRRLSELGSLVGKDSPNSHLPPSSDPLGVGRTRSLRRRTGRKAGLFGCPVAAGHAHWVPVARTDRLTHYACSPQRGKEAMDSTGILPAYTGTVVSDARCAYRQDRQVRHALCGAHLLRELT